MNTPTGSNPTSRDSPDPSPCCATARQQGDGPAAPPERAAAPGPATHRSTQGQVLIPGGVFEMGDHFGEGYRADGESPVHPVRLPPFLIDATSVTNAQFAAFVDATGYVTDAEHFESSAVFYAAVSAHDTDILGRARGAPWWINVRGADWRHPDGPRSDVDTRQGHPVVHVSWHDALAYAQWAGKRLCTEAEWEYASRGGMAGARFPWGEELTPEGRWLCNIWQGRFPDLNRADDGYLATAPAQSFHQNAYGVWNMVGNVWEWCADWFDATTYAARDRTAPTVNPHGPGEGDRRVMRGGSYLCHNSYCYRYRVAARSANTPDSSTSNAGFRCANDAEDTDQETC